jgi:hypothetical protein
MISFIKVVLPVPGMPPIAIIFLKRMPPMMN